MLKMHRIILLSTVVFITFGSHLFSVQASAARQSEIVLAKALRWSPDGLKIAVGYSDGSVQIWDATSGDLINTFSTPSQLVPEPLPVTSVEWSSNSELLAVAISGYLPTGVIWIVNVQTGSVVNTFTDLDEVDALSWSPNGEFLGAAVKQYSSINGIYVIKIWEITDSSEYASLTGHTGIISDLRWSPDGTQILSGSGDQTARIWNIAAHSQIMSLTIENELIDSVAWSPDGSKIATGSSDGYVRIWDATSGQQLFEHSISDSILNMRWNPDGIRFAVVGNNKGQIFRFDRGEILATFQSSLNALDWNPNGSKLVYGVSNNNLQILDTPPEEMPTTTVTPTNVN